MDALDLIDGIAALSHPSEEILYKLIHGKLSSRESAAVVGHLARCAHCRELAEIFGWTPDTLEGGNIVQLPVGTNAAADPARRTTDYARTMEYQGERLAASDPDSASDDMTAGSHAANLVQLVPGATDGDAALGYLCSGGMHVVVVGAGSGPARVLLDGAQYELREGSPEEPRVVEGLTRRHVAIWLASERRDSFTLVYP